MSVASIFKYSKPELWPNKGGENEPKLAPVAGMYYKEAPHSAALQQLDIAKNTTAQISDF